MVVQWFSKPVIQFWTKLEKQIVIWSWFKKSIFSDPTSIVQYRVYPQRWWILTAVVLLNLANYSHWVAFPSVAKTAAKHYGPFFLSSWRASLDSVCEVEGHFNPGLFNHELSNPGLFKPRLFNHELSNTGFFNPIHGVEKCGVEKSGVEKFMVEKSGVEMSGVGKFIVKKSGVEMSFNRLWGLSQAETIIIPEKSFFLFQCFNIRSRISFKLMKSFPQNYRFFTPLYFERKNLSLSEK